MTVTVDRHNLLADVDAGTSLTALDALLSPHGARLPLARPLPRVSLARACAAMPFLVDALVQRAVGTTLDGQPFDTAAAPRAAVGPSLMHALCTRPPLLLLRQARLRVAPAQARVVVRELRSVQDAAQLVHDALEEGRAFMVEAVGTTVLALCGDGTPSLFAAGAARPFAHARGGAFHTTHALPAGDIAGLCAALAAGHRVLAHPQMGRAAVGLRALLKPPRVGAGAPLTQLLTAVSRGELR